MNAHQRLFSITARDGFSLSASVHEPATAPRSVVVVLGATAVPRRFYDRFSAHVAAAGHRVLTFDYRGVGDSRPRSLRGFQASMTDWAELDASAAIEHASGLSPGLRLTVVGHSFGGHVIGLRPHMREVDAFVLVASGLPHIDHFEGASRLKVAAFWYAMGPLSAKLFGYVPASVGLGEDLPWGVVRDWSTWGAHPDYLVGHVDGAAERFASFDRTVVHYTFDDDWYAPPRATAALRARLTAAQLVHRSIAPRSLGLAEVGHFGYFRAQAGERLWPEAVELFDDVAAGRRPRVARAAGAMARGDESWADVERAVFEDLWGAPSTR